jgi:hypothetical protein
MYFRAFDTISSLSHGLFLCEVAKKCRSASVPKALLCERRFMKFSVFFNKVLPHQKSNFSLITFRIVSFRFEAKLLSDVYCSTVMD